MTVTAYVALGSNLGDRQVYLDRALQILQDNPHIVVNQVSSYYETDPVGGPPGQRPFINAAAELQTELPPEGLLKVLLEVEKSLGRVRKERNGPRTIDLDLLLYGDLVRAEPGLTVPHPRMHQRSFVLEPLAEIAPDVVHPGLGKTIAQLWDEFEPADELNEDEGEEGEDDSGQVTSLTSQLRGRPGQRPEVSPARTERELTGLRALVTGSTSGIGRAIALELAAAGADLIIHGRREEAAVEVAAEAEALGVEAGFILADLAQLNECKLLVDSAWESWGPLQIWVNNAGADTLTGEAAGWPFARKLRELFEVDVMATILMSRDVGRRMKNEGSGVLLNMGWDQADTGMEGDSGELFAATKAAVMAFSKSLALSLAPEVRVNCLAPGWIRTAWGANASSRWQDRVRQETPLDRWGTPEDVAAAARWLVSPAAAFVTGQILRVNGGAVR